MWNGNSGQPLRNFPTNFTTNAQAVNLQDTDPFYPQFNICQQPAVPPMMNYNNNNNRSSRPAFTKHGNNSNNGNFAFGTNRSTLNPLAQTFYPSLARQDVVMNAHVAPATPNHNYRSTYANAAQSTTHQNHSSGFAGSSSTCRTVQNSHLGAMSGDTLRERLDDQLRAGSYECMICCEKVRWKDQIWTCSQCYHVFHLRCVKKWANTSNQNASGQNENANGWRCPGCQHVCATAPSDYYCFCGREKDPKPARGFDVPHSCGQSCRRRRKPGCFHPCNLLCHPGPCPPCPKIVEKRCDCGSISKSVRCGMEQFQCDKVCDKVLNCEEHTCARVCHSGPCFPCKEEIELTCYCGKNKRTTTCTFDTALNPRFNCGETCDRKLSCSNHYCEQKCHSDQCAACPFDPDLVIACPCGKTSLGQLGAVVRQSCIDPVPTCDQECQKQLTCGPEGAKHKCSAKCHTGKCPPCPLETKVRCRCGSFNSNVPCVELQFIDADHPYLCNRRCGKRKTCKQHKCAETCCTDSEHLCTQICGRKLSCGTHTCDQLCHSGKCRPCQNASFDELRCFCGSSVVYPPVSCGTRPPTCDKLCTREHACDHPVTHNCHSEPFCPPCSYLTQKWCYGHHEMRRNIPCYLNDISCGKLCFRMLHCEQHRCHRVCHPGPCDIVVTSASDHNGQSAEPVKCKQPCLAAREHCGHLCGAPCHVGTPCPATACNTMLTVTCKCGRISGRMACFEIDTFNSDKSIDATDKFKCLSCDDDCARLERNRRLAKALDIEKCDDLSDETPLYTEYLKTHFKTHSEFLIGLEKTFSELIESLEASKSPVRTKTHVFPPMNRDYRRLIHEYSAFFSIETLSYDSDPMRNVMATASRGKSKIPRVLLSTLLWYEVKPVTILRVAAPTNLNTQKFSGSPQCTDMKSLSLKNSTVSKRWMPQ